MINLLKKIVWKLGFEIKRVQDRNPILYNVFHTDYPKRVLISYLKEPFISGIDYNHTNKTECYTAAELFNELCYRVDVINLYSTAKVRFEDYDVIYGQGPVFERSFYIDKPLSRIYYATGCNYFYTELETAKKVRQFKIKTDCLCPNSGRLSTFSSTLSILLSNKVIVLGNEFVLNTFILFDDLRERYSNLNAFYFDVYDIDLEKKDFSSAKKHFIWFGGSGLLHKGLDIAIEIFTKRDDIVLHICGTGSVYENQVLEYYKPVLQNAQNIVNHGFISLLSDDFKQLMDICSFVISPSISEGGAPSILNVIANGGLIPILSKSSGVNVGEFGWLLADCNFESFNKAVNEASSMDHNVLKECAEKLKMEIRKNYSLEKYRNNLNYILIQSLK